MQFAVVSLLLDQDAHLAQWLKHRSVERRWLASRPGPYRHVGSPFMPQHRSPSSILANLASSLPRM